MYAYILIRKFLEFILPINLKGGIPYLIDRKGILIIKNNINDVINHMY